MDYDATRKAAGALPGGRAASAARRIIAESEGARRERELHELQRQYDAPAWGGDSRRRPSVQDAPDVDGGAFEAIDALLGEGPWGKVIEAALDDSGRYGLDGEVVGMSRAIADGDPKTREWFSRLADAMEASMKAGDATDAGGWDEMRRRSEDDQPE